jgi:WD40 repeat protein
VILNVWSLSICPLSKIVATGGGDSGIKLWNLDAIQNTCSKTSVIAVPSKQQAKTFAFVDNCQIVIVTNTGDVYRQCFSTNDGTEVSSQLIYAHDNFKGWAVLNCINSLYVVAGMLGDIIFLSGNEKFNPISLNLSKKINAIFMHETESKSACILYSNLGCVDIFIYTDCEDHLHHYKLWLDCGDYKLDRLDVLILPRNTVVISLSYVPSDCILVIGTRSGCLSIYDLSTNQKPVIVYRRIHGYNAITSLLIEVKEYGWVINSVGRDGYISKCLVRRIDEPKNTSLNLEICNEGWNIELINQSKITKGWLTKIMIVKEDVVVMGFYDSKFFVYNVTKASRVVKVDCGGGHRIWDFQTENLLQFVFGYIKRDAVNLWRDDQSILDVKDCTLLESYHGLETRCVSVIEYKNNMNLIISGGEDGTLSFHTYSCNGNSRVKHLDSVRKHFASIRCLIVTRSITGNILLFSGGSRHIIKCWKLGLENEFQCIDIATCKAVTELIETRIMDLSSLIYNDVQYVSAGCSDGNIIVLF